jgi:hypothetical protein
MVEAGDRPRLALEPLADFRGGGDVGRKNLDGDGAVEARVPSPVHLAHPAGSQRGQDLVRTKLRSRVHRPPRKRGCILDGR